MASEVALEASLSCESSCRPSTKRPVSIQPASSRSFISTTSPPANELEPEFMKRSDSVFAREDSCVIVSSRESV